MEIIKEIVQEMKSFKRLVFNKPNFHMSEISYDKYWSLREKGSIKSRYFIFLNLVEKGSDVLDIGCGDGTLLKFLMDKKQIRGHGLDISREAVETAKRKGIDAEVCDIMDEKFLLQKSYDYIILSEILEHINNPENVLRKVRDKARKAVIISIPNIGYYPHRIRLLLGRFPLQWAFHPAEHLRFWTMTDFRDWINQLGFSVIQYYVSSGFPYLRKIFPNLFGNQIVFVIKNDATLRNG